MSIPVPYDHKTSSRNTPRDSTFDFGLSQTIFTALEVVLGAVVLVVAYYWVLPRAMNRLKNLYRRYSRRQLQHELVFELEAQLPQVSVPLDCLSE